MSASDANKIIAKAIAEAFGGRPSVTRYWDDAHAHHVDVATLHDHPHPAVSSYATIGLSDWPLPRRPPDDSLRVELLGACRTKHEVFGNILASAAFCVINSQWACSPGAIFTNVVSAYHQSSMAHLLFVPPFLWEEQFETLRLSTKTVAWLLVVPISDAERSFAESQGSEALEGLFEQRSIDIYDLDRPSIL
jgi:hypothetical protein